MITFEDTTAPAWMVYVTAGLVTGAFLRITDSISRYIDRK